MGHLYSFFMLLGGIGLFLFGISHMGKGLEQAAGENLRIWLEKLTTSPLRGVLVGAAVTALIQSSGATMVMVAGFVNAQMMTLRQSLYVMLGAAIGTTVTAQIIAFDIEPWAPLILFIGLVMTQFVRSRSVKRAGAVVLGFGMLFVGIILMGSAVQAMELGALVEAFMTRFDHPALSALFGIAFTFVIQSSSASVGILQVLLAKGVCGFAGLGGTAFMVIGMNVGAVAPLVLSSFSGNRAGKRAAMAEVIVKLLSAAAFSLLLLIKPDILGAIEALSPSDISRQVANFHLLYNIASAALMFPLVGPLAAAVMRHMPDSKEDEFYARKLIYCGSDFGRSPGAMVAQAHREIMRFADICRGNLSTALQGFFEMDEDKAELVIERERTINFLNHEINSYLVSLYSKGLPEQDMPKVSAMFSVASDLERIGDLAENIAEYTQIAVSNRARFSDEAISDIREMAAKTEHMVDISVRCYDSSDEALLKEARETEAAVDAMQEENTERHIRRLKKIICEPRGGVLFTDMLSDLERCSDHALNIAEGMLGACASIEELEVDV